MADKMNGNVGTVIKVVIALVTVGGLIVAITKSHTALSKDVEASIKTIEHNKAETEKSITAIKAENVREHGEYETAIKDIDDTADEINIKIATILTDIEYLKKGQGEILQEVKELKNR